MFFIESNVKPLEKKMFVNYLACKRGKIPGKNPWCTRLRMPSSLFSKISEKLFLKNDLVKLKLFRKNPWDSEIMFPSWFVNNTHMSMSFIYDLSSRFMASRAPD